MNLLQRWKNYFFNRPCKHKWQDSAWGYAYHCVEQKCKKCGEYQHWTGKYLDYPKMEYAPGKAERAMGSRKNS